MLGIENSIEINMIGIAVILGIFQLLLGSVAARTQQGYDWGMGSRDDPAPVSGIPARLQRAFVNYMETFPMFVAAMFAAILAGKTGSLTEIGGYVYLVGRLLFIPLYAAGTRNIRTLAWIVASSGLVAITVAIFIP